MTITKQFFESMFNPDNNDHMSLAIDLMIATQGLKVERIPTGGFNVCCAHSDYRPFNEELIIPFKVHLDGLKNVVEKELIPIKE